jgi:hypothetical protein
MPSQWAGPELAINIQQKMSKLQARLKLGVSENRSKPGGNYPGSSMEFEF